MRNGTNVIIFKVNNNSGVIFVRIYFCNIQLLGKLCIELCTSYIFNKIYFTIFSQVKGNLLQRVSDLNEMVYGCSLVAMCLLEIRIPLNFT